MANTNKAAAVTVDNIFGGAARLVWAETSQTKPEKVSDIIDAGTLKTGWNDFGATDGGLTMRRGYESEDWTVDQVLGAIDTFITNWTMEAEFSCAEPTLENIQMAWAGGTVTTDTTNHQKTMGLGSPDTVGEKMVAFLVDKRKINNVEYIRAYVFWRAKWNGSDSEHSYNKGEKTLIPTTFTFLADPTQTGKEFGIILDQIPA